MLNKIGDIKIERFKNCWKVKAYEFFKMVEKLKEHGIKIDWTEFGDTKWIFYFKFATEADEIAAFNQFGFEDDFKNK